MVQVVTPRDIGAPVGDGIEAAKPKDVEAVVALLNAVPPAQGGPRLPLAARPGSDRLGEAIRRFQLTQFGCMTGRVSPGNVTIRRLNEVYYEAKEGVRGPVRFDPGLPQALPKEFLTAFVRAFREAIVRVARDEARAPDAVSANNRYENGKHIGLPGVPADEKRGWQRLKRYYDETVVGWSWSDDKLRELKAAGVKMAKKSWCGIFAFWCATQAVKAAGASLKLGWDIEGRGAIFRDTNPMRKVPYIQDRNFTVGDICVVDEKASDGTNLVHHVILAEVPPATGTVRTVEGNYWDPATRTNQSVLEKSDRNVREIVGYYNFLAPPEL
jgi:hypothetical protein